LLRAGGATLIVGRNGLIRGCVECLEDRSRRVRIGFAVQRGATVQAALDCKESALERSIFTR
jgi:hypothetical protein